MSSLLRTLGKQLEETKAAGLLKVERVITSAQGAHIRVRGREGTLLNFCANNYLGLAGHPAVQKAAEEGLKTHGYGLASVRFICGTQDIHRQLEEELAAFHGTEDAILYGSCFDANAGLFEAIAGAEDAVVSDELNHASIIDGIRLCKAGTKVRYAHRSVAAVEAELKAGDASKARGRVVVTDGAFSMDGTIAPLRELARVCAAYDALLVSDECHSGGLLGEGGRGVPEVEGCRVDVVQGTLGKAMGGATGGYSAGPRAVVDTLRNRSRPYLFSNSVAPSVVAASLVALRIVAGEEGRQLRQRLAANTALFRSAMRDAGFAVGGDPRHPICPIHFGEAPAAVQAAGLLLERGIYVIPFSFPVVPRGKARIRVQISAAHSPQDIKLAVDAFAKVGKQVGLLQ